MLILGWGMAGVHGRGKVPAEPTSNSAMMARPACSGTQDIGTGTYTILAQLTSQKTGVPLTRSSRARRYVAPEGPVSGGSMVTGSMVPAVLRGGQRDRLAPDNRNDNAGSPFEKRKPTS